VVKGLDRDYDKPCYSERSVVFIFQVALLEISGCWFRCWLPKDVTKKEIGWRSWKLVDVGFDAWFN
jgi:hypothetical protein